MNEIVKYIWSRNLIPAKGLSTTNGEPIHIINYGKAVKEGEHIFSDAKIEVSGITWAGNVLIDCNAKRNEPQTGEQPENIVLHITAKGCPQGESKATHKLCLEIQPELTKELQEVIEYRKTRFQCAGTFSQMSSLNLRNILSRMLIERLEEKAANIEKTLEDSNKSWEDTLFKNLIRSFGFGIQSQEFEELATIINLQALGKHRDNKLQVEAIFFGQAGLLNEESIPYYYKKEALENNYYKELVREYGFLSTKFGLQNMDYKAWNNGRITPHLRIARLAAIYHSQKFSMANIISCNTASELHDIICAGTQDYWYNHSCFGGTENYGNDRLKPRQADILIINTVVPILYVYGKYRNNSQHCSKAEDLLYALNGEENSVIKRWREQGITPQCAADTQALLQLTRRYCQTNNCKECPVAYHYIKSKMTEK